MSKATTHPHIYGPGSDNYGRDNMKPFNDLKDLTFDELCSETQRAFEAKEIEWDVVCAVNQQYGVYQKENPKEKEQTWGEAFFMLLFIMASILIIATFGTISAKMIYTYILFIWKNTIL